MESGGNSSSMQSSSCGEEDSYDSRATVDPSISALFNYRGATISRHHHHNHHQLHVNGPTPNPAAPPHPPRHLLHHQTHFDALATSAFFDLNPLPSSSAPLLNSSTKLPNLHPSDLPVILPTTAASSSTPPRPPPLTQQLLISAQSAQAQCVPTASSKEFQYSGANYSGSGISNSTMGVAVRNPKKRTRASRRAPTTVLTTDTTNFRAMVQEFTGIPSPPFPKSTTPTAGRFDLFGTLPSHTGTYSNILRPFAHRPRGSSPFLSPVYSSSLSPSLNFASSTSSSSFVNFNINPNVPTSGGFELPDLQSIFSMNTSASDSLSFHPPKHLLINHRSDAGDLPAYTDNNQFGGLLQRNESSRDSHSDGLMIRSADGSPYEIGHSNEEAVGNENKTVTAVASLSMNFNGDRIRPEAIGSTSHLRSNEDTGTLETWLCSSHH